MAEYLSGFWSRGELHYVLPNGLSTLIDLDIKISKTASMKPNEYGLGLEYGTLLQLDTSKVIECLSAMGVLMNDEFNAPANSDKKKEILHLANLHYILTGNDIFNWFKLIYAMDDSSPPSASRKDRCQMCVKVFILMNAPLAKEYPIIYEFAERCADAIKPQVDALYKVFGDHLHSEMDRIDRETMKQKSQILGTKGC